MKKDIFSRKNCLWIYLLIGGFIVAASLITEAESQLLWTVFFFVIGGLCLWNYYGCGRVHCQITGYGFLAVGVIALLQILNVINISWNAIWWIFIVVLIVGFGFEFIYKGKKGSCYKKK